MLRAFHRVVGQDAKNQITVAFRNHILPLPAKPEADVDSWVDRFLLVASFVLNPPPESDGETFEPLSDNTDIKTLDSMTGIVGYAKGTLPYRAFIDICEEWNGGDTEKEEASIKSSLNFIVETIARSHFGDSEKARKDLNQFAAANEPRLYKLFKALVDPQTSLRDMIKTKNEFLRRIEQHHESISATFTTLIDSVAWTVLNQSSIPTLIKTIQKGASEEDGDKSQLATHYLGLISKHCSPMFKSHVPHLVVIVNDKKNDSLVETGLEALAAVTKWEKASSPAQKSFLERVKHLALNGTPRQAKFATRFLVFCKDGNAAAELIESLWDEMPAATDAELLPLLRSASELALSAPQTFNAKGEEIASFILTDLVDRPSPSGVSLNCMVTEADSLGPGGRPLGRRGLTRAPRPREGVRSARPHSPVPWLGPRRECSRARDADIHPALPNPAACRPGDSDVERRVSLFASLPSVTDASQGPGKGSPPVTRNVVLY
jgi:sister-chromatid-cohesion protein PDS5